MFDAERLKDYQPDKFQPGYASVKRNGIHGIYTREDKIFSRTPGQIVGLEHLYEPLHRCPFPLVFEIVVPGKDFETASGLIRNFDSVPEAEIHIFNLVHPTMVFSKRWYNLQRFRDLLADKYPQVHVEEMFWVTSTKEFDGFYEDAIELGEEGACWISPNHIYTPGARRWSWMKRVPHRSIEAEVIDILPGTQGKRYQDSLGRMVCKMDGGKEFRVGIFKGQDDAWREKVFLNKDSYIGERVTVIFKTYSKYGTPVQPRFVRFCWDC